MFLAFTAARVGTGCSQTPWRVGDTPVPICLNFGSHDPVMAGSPFPELKTNTTSNIPSQRGLHFGAEQLAPGSWGSLAAA